MGQLLGHDKIAIRGRASRNFNGRNIDSELYKIPKYYFRVDPNPKTEVYEFNGQTRDRILNKFTAKYSIVKNVCDASLFPAFNAIRYPL